MIPPSTKTQRRNSGPRIVRNGLALIPGRSDSNRKEFQRIVGANIYRLRLARNLTATQLANDTGMTTAVLISIECGSKNLQLSRLVRIARRLGVPPEQLLNGVT